MKRIVFAMVAILLVGCSATQPELVNPTPIDQLQSTDTAIPPTITETLAPTMTCTATATETLAATRIPTASPSEPPSPTPEGYPQLYLGLPFSALDKTGCGGYTMYTMDYDKSDGSAIDYWENFPDFPKPTGLTFTTRDGRRALDYCTIEGYPITFQLEEGRVTQNREDGVLDILITKGIGRGLTITHGHVNPDIDPLSPGDQILEVGTIVHFGDLIAYTGRRGIPPGSDAATQTGLLGPDGYILEQELLLIGLDGQPNILYDK